MQSGGILPSYRLYRLDGAGRIHSADWIEAADDSDAVAKAREHAKSARYEVWEQHRLVHRHAPGED